MYYNLIKMGDFRKLASICPAQGCENTEVIIWAHAGCGAHSQVDSEAMVRCSKHTTICDSIMNWGFDCGKHDDHENKFRKPDAMSVCHALSVLRTMGTLEDRLWYEKLSENFMRLQLAD